LHEAIERYGLEHRILMLGYRWDIPDILAACDLVVIASLRTEASPIVLREALASGRPVVATRVGDVDEVIHHRKHGLIVSPGAQEEMAAAILELLQNRELAAKCARNGLQLAREQFCFDRMMHHKLQVDTEVVALHRDQSTARAATPLARDYIGN
jgi:glycosyltransferase involved in cell wall biosynthesis